MNETRPLVSVSTTTFNLEATLGRALDSVLMQKRTFPMEIVIGDDASTDGTLLIARAYREKHPSIIRLIEREKTPVSKGTPTTPWTSVAGNTPRGSMRMTAGQT